jgi:hypothetical protein
MAAGGLMATKKRCFVISPIGAPGSDVRVHADDVYNYIIEPVTKNLGYDTQRGDHMARPGRISEQMYESILHDDLLIAVLTFQNSFDMWMQLRRTMPRLSVRKVRKGIVYQQLFMNESRMLYTPYNMLVTTYYSATIQADRRSPLYSAQGKEFDFLWERADAGNTRKPGNRKKRTRAAKRSR